MFFQSEIVKIKPPAESGAIRIPAVQSVGVSFATSRQDITSLGRFAPYKYRPSTQWPVVNLNLEYIPTGNNIEKALGLNGENSVIDYLISGQYGYKMSDYSITLNDFNSSDNHAILNIKSGVITNYSFQASVGQIPRTSITVEGLDMGIDSVSSVESNLPLQENPILRPQDIKAILPNGILGVKDLFLQNFNLTIPLQRTPLIKLGDEKPFSRELQPPVIAQFQVNAYIESFNSTDGVSGDSIELQKLSRGTPIDGNILINVKRPSIDGTSEEDMITYFISQPYLDNYNISNAVGGYTSIDLQFSVPVTYERGSGEGNIVIT